MITATDELNILRWFMRKRAIATALGNAGVTKQDVKDLIHEVALFADTMDAARPATSLAGACTAPFAGALQNQINMRALVLTHVIARQSGFIAQMDALQVREEGGAL